MARKKVYLNCPKCGRKFAVGYDGVYDWETDTNICDLCAGVMRETDTGYAWLPGQTQQERINVGDDVNDESKHYIVTREQALGKGR